MSLSRQLEKSFKKLKKSVESVSGEYTLAEILTPSFVRKYTSFLSPDDLLLKDESEVTDEYVSTHSSFQNLKELAAKAAEVHAHELMSKALANAFK